MASNDNSPAYLQPATSVSRARDGIALTCAMLLPLLLAWVYFIVLDTDTEAVSPLVQLAFAIGKAIQALLPALYLWRFERDRLAVTLPTGRGLLAGAGFAALVGAAIWGLYHGWLKHSSLLGDTPVEVLRKVQQFGLASPGGYLLLGMFLCVVHSLFEEYYWRWFLFARLKRHVPALGAASLSGFAFMLHHIIILGVFFPGRFWLLAVPFSICVGVGGAVWAWLYHRSGSLYAAWLSHALIDAAILLVGYDMVARHL
jgi:membrane protease YdiL (CAAX protease family)